MSSEDEDHVINPGSCSGEVVSDTDSNGSRFDDGEDRGEDLCDSGGESDDGTDGGGGGGGDDGGCSVNNDDKDRNLKKENVVHNQGSHFSRGDENINKKYGKLVGICKGTLLQR